MQVPWVLAASLVLLVPRAGVARDDKGSPPHADRASARAAWSWFDVLYDVVRLEALAPPQASRVYGVSAVALYESVAPGARAQRSLAGQLSGLDDVPQPPRGRKLHWPSAAGAAVARTVRGLFPALKPESLAAIEALERDLEARFRAETTPGDYLRSVRYGREVGDAILAWSAGDGYATRVNCAYVPQPVEGAWAPTPPGFAANPLQPCWGELRPMALRSSEACSLPGPPAFTGAEFLAAAVQVYQTSLDLTDEQRTIAAYWADGSGATGTPAGHWMAIVGQIARNERLSLAEAAEAFARAGIAVHDAFIQCWQMKFAYNLQRPVTYIRANIDANWLPPLVTPPFPTYASGHSTQSGAVATVLEVMFGRMAFRDTLHQDHGLTPALEARAFRSFGEAAREAAVSRLYGGIHFGFDNDDGLAAGQCIGRTIARHVEFKRHGDR